MRVFVLLIALGFSISAQAQTSELDKMICDAFQGLADDLNKDVGAEIERTTTSERVIVITDQGVSLLCNASQFTHKRSISVPISSMPEIWVAHTQKKWNQLHCENPARVFSINNGWTIAMSMTDVDGRMQKFVARCD